MRQLSSDKIVSGRYKGVAVNPGQGKSWHHLDWDSYYLTASKTWWHDQEGGGKIIYHFDSLIEMVKHITEEFHLDIVDPELPSKSPLVSRKEFICEPAADDAFSMDQVHSMIKLIGVTECEDCGQRGELVFLPGSRKHMGCAKCHSKNWRLTTSIHW